MATTTSTANAHRRSETARRLNKTATKTSVVITNARMQETLCPEIRKYANVKKTDTTAAGLRKSYRPSPNGNRVARIRKKTKSAIMLMCIPEIERKCARPEVR